MRKNNRGFSYVELLLVIAIMAIMTAMIGLSANIIGRNNVTKSAAKLESALNSARMTSLSKGSEAGAFNIKCEDGIVSYSIGPVDTATWIKLAQSPVYITVGDGSSNSDVGSTPITYKYNPSSGSFKTDAFPGQYLIFSNSKKEAKVHLYRQTGKCKVEY